MITTALETLKLIILLLIIIYAILAACGAARRKDIAATIVWCTLWITYADVEGDANRAVGTCWTNRAYAPYVEFGTGPKGQADHAGISPEVTPVYTQVPWWIHESQVDRRTAEKYRWFYINTPQGRFYQCTGQPAHPFLYPALHDNEDKILKNMKASFQADIGKESK